MADALTYIEQINFPTRSGDFLLTTYQTTYPAQPLMRYAMVLQTPQIGETPLVRIQSSCLFGETFHTTQCDCGEQLEMSMQMLAEQGGILLYLDQEGRGHGIFDKTRELKLQESGLDTLEASESMGLLPDARSYQVALDILQQMHIGRIKLITNNPRKLKAFEGSNIEITERVPLEVELTPANSAYLKAKKHKLGHLLNKYVD